ncbi:MAG: VTT domain-containing protein [Usitatibacter sp.]
MAAKTRGIPWKLIAAALTAAALLALASFVPVADWADRVEDRIETLSLAEGLLIFAALYFVATMLLVPAWIFPIAAGSLFGFAWGLAIALATAMASTMAAFFAARYVLRDRVRKLAGRFSAFAACEKALAVDGWKVVALLRLSPLLPFGVKNYLFGVTRVKLADYGIGSLAGLAPGMIFKVYLGWAGRYALGSEGGAMKWVLCTLGLAATAGGAYLVARRAKASLKLA